MVAAGGRLNAGSLVFEIPLATAVRLLPGRSGRTDRRCPGAMGALEIAPRVVTTETSFHFKFHGR